MVQIAVRNLKAGLSRVLARARAGDVIEVTSHSRPIARIIGIPAAGEDGLQRMVATGVASWGGGRPQLEAPVSLSPDHLPVSRMVLEDRR